MLQKDLYQMEKRSNTWLLQIHPGKCVVTSVGIWWNIIRAYPYELLSTALEHVLEEKDLGIIIDSELTFESHIEANLGTENQMVGIIRRSFTCCTAKIVIPLYKAFVRQHPEFGVAVWGGFIKRRQFHAIGNVQMRATEIVESVKGMPYEERWYGFFVQAGDVETNPDPTTTPNKLWIVISTTDKYILTTATHTHVPYTPIPTGLLTPKPNPITPTPTRFVL